VKLKVTASEVVVIPANAEELIAAVHTISTMFSNSNGRRAAVLADANWNGKNMLFDSHNCATYSRTRSMGETRRKRGSGPDCLFGKEICAIELERTEISYYLKNVENCVPISSVSNCEKTFSNV